MNTTLNDRLRAAGMEYAPGNRELLQLTDPATAWWVEHGTIDVFAVPAVDGAPAGAREHLYRVESGQLLFGMDPVAIGPDWTLIAVATSGTRLRTLPWWTLATLVTEPALHGALAAIADAWVSAVTRGARKGIQPKLYTPLNSGETQDLTSGQAFFPLDRLAYIRLEQGEAVLLSQDALRVTPQSGLLPLRDDAWLHATTDCRVHTLGPDAALTEPGFWDGLQVYHALIVRVSLTEFERIAAHETTRMQIKAQQAAAQMQSGLSVFVHTLTRTRSTSFGEVSDDPLLAACQLIGRQSGIDFQLPPRSGLERADPVEEIANAARVRFRQIALRGEWWRTDGGHLLARVQDTRQPVALIRTRHGYELHDPVARTITPVDETLAATLAPFAQAFFRSLPSRPLRFRDLAGFSLQNMGGDFARMLGLGMLVGLLGMLMPIITGYVFDTVIPASDRSQAWQIIGALIAVALATAMFSVARAMATLRMESRMDASLQAALWDRALNLPIPFFRLYSAGDLAQRLLAINVIRQALSGTTIGTLLASAFALVNIALLFYYDVKLAAVAVALLAGATALTVVLGLFKLRYDRPMAAAMGRLSGLVLEYLRGVTKLRVTGAESRAFANWAREFASMRRLAFGSGNVQNINDVFFSLYQVVVDIVIFATVAWLLKMAVLDGALAPAHAAGPGLTTGRFIAFYGAFGMVMGAVMGLSTTLLTILNLVPVYERMAPILRAEPETDAGKTHPGELQGQIDLVNVTFRYGGDGPPVLDNVSFSIRPGGFIAVVGPSGSGKSTLLRCLLGFEDPAAGGVFYDNQNLADLDTRAVRRQMGVVLQHSQVMPGDIFGNIVGTTQLNIDDAWAAARYCGLEDDIKAMPMGMHTVISEGGNTLSGGQRQRILIARAIVQRPRILLFDEATSALDNRTQEIVTRSLEQLRATRIVIAHRLTTIMNADRIIVLDKGRIVQSGSYPQLIAQPGLFQDLAKRQLI